MFISLFFDMARFQSHDQGLPIGLLHSGVYYMFYHVKTNKTFLYRIGMSPFIRNSIPLRFQIIQQTFIMKYCRSFNFFLRFSFYNTSYKYTKPTKLEVSNESHYFYDARFWWRGARSLNAESLRILLNKLDSSSIYNFL